MYLFFCAPSSGGMTTSSCIQVGPAMAGLGVLANLQVKIGDDDVLMSAAIGVGMGFDLSTLSLCLSYSGTLYNAFGIKGFDLSDFSGSVGITWTYVPPAVALTSLAISATAKIGPSYTSTIAFSYSADPTMDYVFLSLDNGLTLGQIMQGFGFGSLPAGFSNLGFQSGSYFSWSLFPQVRDYAREYSDC